MTRKTTGKTICYYISGHGFGHAARACQVMGALPADVKLIVRSSIDPAFIARESGRKVEVIPGRFDTGVAQKDNRTLDWPATLKQARQVGLDTSAGLLDEIDFLRKRRVDVMVCDVPPAPLEAARMAGIPSIVVGNFTWVEIFGREGKKLPQAAELAERWRDQYSMATLAVRTPPAFPMEYFPRLKTVEPIARRGRNIRASLLRHLGTSTDSQVVLMYFGNYGDSGLQVPEIEGVRFTSFTGIAGRVTELDPAEWHFPDVVASVDCVMAKPGYGTVGECMANGTPLVYHARTEFAEYAILKKAIDDWGGGVMLSPAQLARGNWKQALEQAFALNPERVRSRGAQQTAELIMDFAD